MSAKLRLAALLGWFGVATVLGIAGLDVRTPGQAATPPPLLETPITPPPLSATATPTPSGALVRFAGQLLEVREGYAIFTTGDAFRLAPDFKTDDAWTGGATTLKPATRVYARAAFDTGNGNIVELALSKRPLPPEAKYEDVERYAVALSTPAPNPELRPAEGFNGKPVLVVWTVEVPPKTPFTDSVYLATDVSGWSATAIKMDRVDALHYRVALDLRSGTRILYRYTRGSWQSAERGQDGLEVKPRLLLVPNADVRRIADVVYHWGDENGNAPDLGAQGIPTPYNPIPFLTPPPPPPPRPPTPAPPTPRPPHG